MYALCINQSKENEVGSKKWNYCAQEKKLYMMTAHKAKVFTLWLLILNKSKRNFYFQEGGLNSSVAIVTLNMNMPIITNTSWA